MHRLRRYRIAEKGLQPHFITWTVEEWLPVFVSDSYCQLITDSLEYCRQQKGLLVHAYVVMPTHVHAVISAEPGTDLSEILRDSRKHTSKEIVRQVRADGLTLFDWVFRDAARKAGRPAGAYKVWQDGFHPETLESEKFFLQKLEYLHNNPVRKGLVGKPEYWWHSSAGSYILREEGPLELDILDH